MMKLYFSKGACSLAPHIVLEETGIPYEAIAVDFSAGQNETPEFKKLNPMGAVPVLVTDNSQALTEGVAIMQYLADLKPEAKLAPANGTWERTRLHETLNFLSTEIHKGFSPFFGLSYVSDDAQIQTLLRKNATEQLTARLDALTEKLGQQEYLLASGYSVADAYLFTLLSWAPHVKFDMSKWPTLSSHWERVRNRPAVQRALKAEGIL